MKTKNRQFLALSAVVALTLSVAITSCKKDKDENTGASAQFSATVNGAAFKPSIVSAVQFNNYIMIIGYEARSGADTALLELNIPDTVTVNSKLSFEDVAGLDYYNLKQTWDYGNYYPSHGTVTITTVDKTNKKIAGTFDCVLYPGGSGSDSVIVKDGKFNTTWKSF
jgi:hypothetical protein